MKALRVHAASKKHIFRLAGGVGLLVFVLGVFFFTYAITERQIPWHVFFACFLLLNAFHAYLLWNFWKRRKMFSISWRALIILWGGVATWYWLVAPIYYSLTVNLNKFQISWLGFIYLWELVAIGGIFVGICLYQFQRFRRYMERGEVSNPEQLYWDTFRYPLFVAVLLFTIAVFGYTVGTFQLRVFADLPQWEQVKSLLNGMAVSVFLGIFYYLVFDRFLEQVRFRLEQEYSIRSERNRKISFQILGVMTATILGGMMMGGLLIVQSWQQVVSVNVARDIERSVREYGPEIRQAFSEDRFAYTNEERDTLLQTLQMGERGAVFFIDSVDELSPDFFAPVTRSRIDGDPSGIVEDWRIAHKIVWFSEEMIPDQTLVSIAFVEEFYGEMQIPFGRILTGAFVVFSIIIGVVAFLSLALTGRIRDLLSLIRRAESGETADLYPIVSSDELDALSRRFIQYASQEREFQESLEQERFRYQEIIRNVKEGLVVTDAKGRVTDVNPAVTEMLGYKTEELIGKRWALDVPKVEDEVGDPIPESSRVTLFAVSQKKVMTHSYYYVRKDGSRVPVHVTAGPFIVGDAIHGTVTVFRDATEEKQIEKTKNEFVLLASHQLRTPLTLVSWSSEKLLRMVELEGGGDRYKKYLTQLYDANNRMIELVEALLNVSRIELGEFTFTRKPVDCRVVADAVAVELRPRVLAKNLKLEVSYANDLPYALADPQFLRIVFQNLLSNAVKYTPEGGRVTFVIRKEDPEYIGITVRDTGYGIPESQRDKIFSKLFRADNVVQREQEGTGLGLYIAKSIIERAGGTIWFESEENKGTTFHVRLPIFFREEGEEGRDG